MITIEDVIKQSALSEIEKKALLEQLNTLNNIDRTVQLVTTQISELIPIVIKHLEILDNDPTLHYNKFSIYEQIFLSRIGFARPYHGHID